MKPLTLVCLVFRSSLVLASGVIIGSMGSAQDFFQISVMELEDLAHVLKRVLQMCLGSLFPTLCRCQQRLHMLAQGSKG